MKIRFIIILFLLIKESAGILFAQSLRIGALPMQFNPSFAGSTGTPRFAAIGNYGYYNNYNTALSYDNFITKYSTGVGIMVNYNNSTFLSPYFSLPPRNHEKRGILSATGVIAPKISIRGKYTLSPSIGLNYLHEEHFYLNYPKTDTTSSSSNQFSLQGGFLFNAEKYYLGAAYFGKGLSINNILGNEYKLNNHGTLVLSAGYVFKRPGSKFSFSPNICILYSPGISPLVGYFISETKRHTDLLINFNFKYKNFIWGVGNGIMSGYQNDKIRLTYTQSFLNPYGGYRGELSARIILNKKNGKIPNITNVKY